MLSKAVKYLALFSTGENPDAIFKPPPSPGLSDPRQSPQVIPPAGIKHNVLDGLSLHSKDTAPDLKNIVGADDHGLGLHILALWGYIFWIPARGKNRFPCLR